MSSIEQDATLFPSSPFFSAKDKDKSPKKKKGKKIGGRKDVRVSAAS
jgi:hypothetical protein